MANNVTRYNNGTFESPQGTWNDQIAETHVLSNDFASEGVASCKITLPISLNPMTEKGGRVIFIGEFPVGAVGEETEIRLHLKVTAPVPDDMYFFIAGLTGFTTVKATTVVVKGSDCKTGFVELKANFAAGNAYPAPGLSTAMFLYAVRNMNQLQGNNPELFTTYPELSSFNNNVAWPGAVDIYIDQWEAEAKAIPPIASVDPQFGDLLYHKENIFIMSDGVNMWEVNEPVGWDKLLITLQLDQVLWSYKFEFTDKDLTLQFDDAAGRQTLFDAYRADGCDAKMFLMFGIVDRTDTDNPVIDNVFEMQFNFDTYEEDETFVKLNLSRRSFNDLLKNRWETDTSLDATRTIDGTNLTPLKKFELWLHPIRVQYNAKFKYDKVVNISDNIVWTSNPDLNTNLENAPPFKKTSSNVPDLMDPIDPDGQLLYANLTGGQISRRLDFDIKLFITLTFLANSPGPNFTASLILYKKNFLKGPKVPVTPPTDGEFFIQEIHNLGQFAGTFNVAFDSSAGILLNRGEALFVKIFVETWGVGITGKYRLPNQWVMTASDNSNSAPTVVKTYHIFEAINRQLQIVTNKPNLLKSNLLGRIDLGYDENGCGSHHLMFNGKMVRGVQNFLNLSAKGWFTLVNTLYCAGMSVERDNDGNEFARIEELSYFFKDVELLRLDVISDYSKECSTDNIFNELLFGYSKFPQDNQNNSLDEPFNQIGYITPIKQVKNKLEVICNFILGSLYILYTQDQKFKDAAEILVDADKPKSTFETDNENFLVSILEDMQTGGGGNGVIDATKKTITISGQWKIPIITGDDLLVFTPTFPLGVTCTCGNLEILTPPVNQFVIYYQDGLTPLVSEAGVIGIILGQSILGDGRYVARTMEDDFDFISGINFPETRYNMEHHIKRMLFRWSGVIRACLDEKDAAELIQFVSGKVKTSLETTDKDAYPCKPNPDIITTYADSRSEAIANFKKALFKSNVIKFRAPLSWKTVNDIKKAFENRHPQGKDYGYVTITNPYGEIEKGRFRLMKYEPVTTMATFELLEIPKDNG